MSRTRPGGSLEPATSLPAQTTQPNLLHVYISGLAMGPSLSAWGYFESFLVPVLDNVVSKGNLARCWLGL